MNSKDLLIVEKQMKKYYGRVYSATVRDDIYAPFRATYYTDLIIGLTPTKRLSEENPFNYEPHELSFVGHTLYFTLNAKDTNNNIRNLLETVFESQELVELVNKQKVHCKIGLSDLNTISNYNSDRIYDVVIAFLKEKGLNNNNFNLSDFRKYYLN